MWGGGSVGESLSWCLDQKLSSNKGVNMSELKILTVLSFLLLFLSSIANAEITQNRSTLKQNPKTLAYLTDSNIQNNLIEVGKALDKNLGVVCTEQFTAKFSVDTISVVKPIDFPDENQHPIDGLWQYRFEFTRCGQTSIYNAAVVAKKDSMPQFLALVPGNSIASPALQIDTIRTIVFKVMTEAKVKSNRQCDDLAIVNTTLSILPEPLSNTGVAGRWEERWTVRYCGEAIPMPVCFTPNAKGTSILTETCKEAN
jgi:hypothetical protein